MVVECITRNESIEGMKKNYIYRLTKDNISISLDMDNPSDEAMVVPTYGIEIERQDIVNDCIINIERDSVESISPYRHKVHDLIKLLFDNCVSPIHLIEVLGDYIDEYIVDFNEDLKEIATN
jgi:hypothetical protein